MKTRTAGWLIFSFVVATFGIYATTLVVLTWPISELSIAKSGTFGDSFGALNALFSGLAFVGLIITVMLQRDEMHLSRMAFERQQFEASFFQLLNLYGKNLGEIRITQEDTGQQMHGIDAIAFLIKRLRQELFPYSKSVSNDDGRMIYEFEVCKHAKSVLVHQSRYLSTLQHLLDLVFRYTKDEVERERYTSIIGSQLTSTEFKYLFYRCLVLPTSHDLVRMVNLSRPLRAGFATSIVTKTDIALYERLHGVILTATSTFTRSPYPLKLIRRIKRRVTSESKPEDLPSAVVK